MENLKLLIKIPSTIVLFLFHSLTSQALVSHPPLPKDILSSLLLLNSYWWELSRYHLARSRLHLLQPNHLDLVDRESGILHDLLCLGFEFLIVEFLRRKSNMLLEVRVSKTCEMHIDVCYNGSPVSQKLSIMMFYSPWFGKPQYLVLYKKIVAQDGFSSSIAYSSCP